MEHTRDVQNLNQGQHYKMWSLTGWMMLFVLAGSARCVTFSPHVSSIGSHTVCNGTVFSGVCCSACLFLRRLRAGIWTCLWCEGVKWMFVKLKTNCQSWVLVHNFWKLSPAQLLCCRSLHFSLRRVMHFYQHGAQSYRAQSGNESQCSISKWSDNVFNMSNGIRSESNTSCMTHNPVQKDIFVT